MSTPEHLAAALADRYELLRELGAGGMATVYLARDVRHAREVAIKVLHPELAAVLGAERFLSEIRTTASLQHPHILPLFDSGEAAGQLFYVMPFVDGETLRTRLERETQLPIADALRIAREVADALQYAHERGVIHRDIKPENILLQGGHALVADFGIALAVTNAGGARMTQTGLSLGTPQYMAPEQAMGERTIDARADVYALGAVTYEMLAGEPPFTGPTAQAIVAKVMSTEPQRLDVLRRNVPAHVAEAVHHALEKLPADRFSSARAFADTVDGRLASAPARTATIPAATETRAPSRVAPMVPWALTVSALLFAGWTTMRRASSNVTVPRVHVPIALPDSTSLAPVSAVSLRPRRLALSLDGRTLVFLGPGPNGNAQLWQRPLDGLTASRLPGTEGASNPTFAPDGSARLLYITSPPQAVLRLLDLPTGTSLTITDSLLDDSGLGWSEDGYAYVARRIVGSGISRVRVAPRSAPELVTMPDTAAGEFYHTMPSVLPGGRGIVFTIVANHADLGTWQVGVWDAATRTHRALVRAVAAWYAPTGHLVYLLSEGTLLAAPFDLRTLSMTDSAVTLATHVNVGGQGQADVAVSADGTIAYITGTGQSAEKELVIVDRDGRVARLDSTFRGRYRQSLAVSPDGRSVLAVRGTGSDPLALWQMRLDGSSLRRVAEDAWEPSWSFDGSRITWLGLRDRQVIWQGPADGNRAPAVVSRLSSGRASMTRATSDERAHIAVVDGDIFSIRPPGDSAWQPLLRTREREQEIAISPDGRWIAIGRRDAGALFIDVHPFPDVGRQRWRVSTRGGVAPRWSRDGRTLYFRHVLGDLYAVPVRAGTTLDYGAPQLLLRNAQLGFGGAQALYDVLPDGRFLIARPVGAGERPVEHIVLHTRALAHTP